MNRPPLRYQDIQNLIDENPEASFIWVHYFGLFTRQIALRKLQEDEMLIRYEHGEAYDAAQSLRMIINAMENTTDEEYVWISKKIRALHYS